MARKLFETQEISLDELDRSLEKYPYFAVLHFVKAGMLAEQGGPGASAAMQKAALYFNSPHWLELELTRETEEDYEDDEVMAEILTTPVETEPLEQETADLAEAEIELEEKETAFDDRRLYPEQEVASTNTGKSQAGETEPDDVIPAVEVESQPDETEPDDVIPAVEVDEILETAETGTIEEEIAEAEVNRIEEPEGPVPFETVESAPHPQITETESLPPDDSPIDKEVVGDRTEGPVVVPDNRLEVDIPPAEATQLHEEPLIPLEPLHTVDYFASQGIKVPADDVPTDKLGVKLKSFTEWLKSMKRLHPEKLDRQMDQATEQTIRSSAEVSNEQQALYTEALAEVYVKQGLLEKAREVYRKLSLLDPSKSAYFAARIEELKEF